MSPNPLYPFLKTQILFNNLTSRPVSPPSSSPRGTLVKAHKPIPGIYEVISPVRRILRYIEGESQKEMSGVVMWEDLFIAGPRYDFENSSPISSCEYRSDSDSDSESSTSPLIGMKRGGSEDESMHSSSSSSSTFAQRPCTQSESSPPLPLAPQAETMISDIAGYHKLRHPQHLTYNPIMNRWLFNKELRNRTATYTVHKPAQSLLFPLLSRILPQSQVPNKKKERGKRREFFVLDDGKTWIMTGYLDGKKVDFEQRGVFRLVEGKGMVMLDKSQEGELDMSMLRRGVCFYRDEEDEDYYVDLWRYHLLGRASQVEFVKIAR